VLGGPAVAAAAETSAGRAPSAATAPAERVARAPSEATARDRSHQLPRTLARAAAVVDRRPLTGPRRIDFVAAHWRGGEPDGARVRFRRDGAWTAWQPLPAGEIHPPGRVASELVPAGRATAYEVRAPRGASDVRAVAINTTDGPREPVWRAATSGASQGLGLPGTARLCYRSRARWGADESLRFDAAGGELWPPQSFPAQRLTVHHTFTDPATEAGVTDPLAVVRAIYRYHAVDLGFGDIGYHLLIDQRGCVYEGRHSGPDPVPVYTTPTTLTRPGVVIAGHVLGYNPGNIGIALLGDLNVLEPSADSLRALTASLAALSLVSGLDPKGYGTYVNPLTGAAKDTHVLGGHRDWLSTECPGEHLYALLPALREHVAALLPGARAAQGISTSRTRVTLVRART
jgi:N-acetylmuramoyl-L-alanine amidase